jgi:hypothetical protein
MSSPANRHRPCGRSSLSLALLFLPPFQLLYRSVAAYGRELLLQSLQGGAATPLAYKILCVRFTYVVHARFSVLTRATLSVIGATLDTGGWLALTRDPL